MIDPAAQGAAARTVILASGSPRRRELLAALGATVVVRPTHAPEDWPRGQSGAEAVLTIARRKLAAAPAGPEPVLAADTVVFAPGGRAPLGKPIDDGAARAMLATLAGQRHRVITGFVLRVGKRVHAEAVSTAVTFRPLTPAAIAAYVATGEGRDKAGSYAIQGAGAALVDRLDGSLTGVIGLPLAEVAAALAALCPGWGSP